MVMEVNAEEELKSNEDDIIAALKKYSVLYPDDDEHGTEPRVEVRKPDEAAGPAMCADVAAVAVAAAAAAAAENKDVRISQSHSKKVIKHALRQQAKRRRKNTTIASGSSEHVLVKSAGLDAGHVAPSPAPQPPQHLQPSQPRPGMATMREVLASIPGFSVKPRRRSSKKLSTAAQLEQTKEGCVDLETPDSILAGSNLRLLLNKHTFSALPPLYQYKLMQLLPSVDQADVSLRLSSSGLNNEFFARACLEWNERLSEGEFTPENQQRLKAEAEKEMSRLDPWKLKHFEPIWGERHESYSFDVGCAGSEGDSLKPSMKLRPSAAAAAAGGRPAGRPRTVGAVTRAITSCRDEPRPPPPPPPTPRHKRQADHALQLLAKKPKSEDFPEAAAAAAAAEEDPFAPSDTFNDSDHSAYEPTVEHADDVIHESAILRPPAFSPPPPLPPPPQLGGQELRVGESRQAAVWTNQDEDERISAMPEEWRRQEVEPARVSDGSEPLQCRAMQVEDAAERLCSTVDFDTAKIKLDDFKAVQCKLAEFEAAQSKLTEIEAAQSKLEEFEAAQSKQAEFEAAQSKLTEIEAAQSKLTEIEAAQSKLEEFEAAQSKQTEFESAQSKLAEFESAQSNLAEIEAALSKQTELEAAQSKQAEFEAAQSKLAEFEAAQSKQAEFESVQSKQAEFEAAQSKFAEFEAAQSKLAEFEAAQSKLAKFEAVQSKLAEFESGQSKLAEFEAAQSKLAEFEAAQSKLAEFEAARSQLSGIGMEQNPLSLDVDQSRLLDFGPEEIEDLEPSQSPSEGLRTPDISDSLVGSENKTPDVEDSQEETADFEHPQLDKFSPSESPLRDYGQIETAEENYSPPHVASEDFGRSNAIQEDLIQSTVVPDDLTELESFGEPTDHVEALSESDSLLEQLEQSTSHPGNECRKPAPGDPSQSIAICDSTDDKPDCSSQPDPESQNSFAAAGKLQNFQRGNARYDVFKMSTGNMEDSRRLDERLEEFSHSRSNHAECKLSEGKLEEYSPLSSSCEDFKKSEKNADNFPETSSCTKEMGQSGLNVDVFSLLPTSTTIEELCEASNVCETFSQASSSVEDKDQSQCNPAESSEQESTVETSADFEGGHRYESSEMEAALLVAVSGGWEAGPEVKAIPMHEELEVRLEEGSFPVEGDLAAMNWFPVAAGSGGGQRTSAGDVAEGEAYSRGQALKLELEVTLTPEAPSVGGGGGGGGGPPMSVIPPTTIVCLPSLVVNSPHLVTHGGGSGGRPASSSAVPFLALSGATPLRALTQLHKPGAGAGVPFGLPSKHKPPRDPAQGGAGGGSGRSSRGASNRPPPGAVNLERSYQICQAVIQNSPNRDQLRAQLKPPPPLLTGPKRGGPAPPPHPGLVTGAKGVRALPAPAAPRATPPPPPPGVAYDRPLRLPSPPPPPPGVVAGGGAGLVRHVFTSAHGIPVTMAVLPQGGGAAGQDVTIAQDAGMPAGGQYFLVHRAGEPMTEVAVGGRRNPGPPRASSAPPANRNLCAYGVRAMGGRGRPASVDVRQESASSPTPPPPPTERYLVACPSPGIQAVSRRRDNSQHGLSYGDVGDSAALARTDAGSRLAARSSGGGGGGFAAQCGCNARPMVVCRKCGAFCHDDCISAASICGSCLVR